MTKKQKTVAAWTVVIIAFLGGLALANVQNKVPPCIAAVMLYFDIGETTAGWLTSVFAIMGMVTAIPASWLLAKLGPKKIGVLSLAFAAVGSLIGVFSTNLWLLIFSRIIEGMGVGIIAVVGPSLIAMWFPAEKRGLPMGLWGSWMMASQTILFFISGGLVAAFDWQGVWWFTLIFCVIVLILYMWKVDSPGDDQPNYAEQTEENFSFKGGFGSASTWILTAAGTIFTFCCFGFATFIALYWGDTFFGGDYDQSNRWVSIMYLIEVPVVIFLGWVMNHIRLRHRKYMGVIGFFLYTFILYLCFRMENPLLLLPFVLIYPFLEGAIPTAYWTMCASTAKKPEYAGIALGIMNVGLNIGTLLGPPVTGFFIENYGWHAATIPLAIASVAGAVLFFFVKTYDHGTGDTKLPKPEEASVQQV